MDILKFYLVYIPLAVIATILIIKYLNKKDSKQRYRFLIILATIVLIIHLTKPFFFPYNTKLFPNILRKITFENICAVSALIYLPVLLWKNKIALDYIAIIGMLGGFLAFLVPSEVILGRFDSMVVTDELELTKMFNLFNYDTIRFYVTHYLLFLIPFLLLYYDLHRFNIKRIFYFPISVITILLIIFLNELVLHKLGWLDEIYEYVGVSNYKEVFFDHNIRNSSFVFGIPDEFGKIGLIFTVIVPKFLKTPYVPVAWIIIPAFVYGPLLYLGFLNINKKILIKKRKKVRMII